jgi:glycosyltransferase involved in cell wall biosynthesis
VVSTLNPPRIGFNAAFYTPRKVGINTVIRNLAARLARKWSFVIYTAYPADFGDLDAETRTIPDWAAGRLYTRLPWEYLDLPRRLKRDRIDLLLSPVSELPPRLAIPAIAVVHDLTPLALPGSSRIHHTVLFWLSLHLLGAASSLVFVSEYSRSDLDRMKLYPDKPKRVIHNGTHFLDLYAGNAPKPRSKLNGLIPDRPYLLYVGGFPPHKNAAGLIDVFRQLAPQIPHQLVMVGWGPERIMVPLRSSLDRIGLADRVTILHDVDDLHLLELYRRCDLFIYPSRYEGFGLPVLEAMACGAPVMCSNATSLPEVGGDAVVYFSPDSGDDLRNGILALLGDPDRRRDLSEKGRARAAGFTWERAASEYSRVIEETLKKKR